MTPKKVHRFANEELKLLKSVNELVPWDQL